MISHETLEKFLSLSLKAKLFWVGGALAVILLIIAGLVSAGHKIGDYRAHSKWAKEQAALEKQIADSKAREDEFKTNAAKYAAQNEILKQQNEAQAKLIEERGVKADIEKTRKLQAATDERNKQYENIDNTDSGNQLCALCADSERAGHKLSDTLCGECPR